MFDRFSLYAQQLRVYDPTPGSAGMRWLQRDPAFFVDGLNLYAYCGGDPVNGRDPMGLANEPPDLDTILRELERIERVLEEIDELPDEQRTQLTNRRKDLESQLPKPSTQGSNPIEEAMEEVDRSTCDGPMTTPRTGPKRIATPPRGQDKIPVRDDSGKVHGEYENRTIGNFDPKRATPDEREFAREEVKRSLEQRRRDFVRLGRQGDHGDRIAEEEALLRRIERELEDRRRQR